MSKEVLMKNIQVLAQVLEIEPPILDEDNSFVLEINSQRSVFFTYEPDFDQLFIYTPINARLPTSVGERQMLFQNLLEAAFRFSSSEIGTIGFNAEQDEVLFYNRISLGDANEIYLAIFVPSFLEVAIHWQDLVDRFQDPKYQRLPEKKAYRKSGGNIVTTMTEEEIR